MDKRPDSYSALLKLRIYEWSVREAVPAEDVQEMWWGPQLHKKVTGHSSRQQCQQHEEECEDGMDLDDGREEDDEDSEEEADETEESSNIYA